MNRPLLPALALAALSLPAIAQVAPGFRLYGPAQSSTTYLIDNTGAVLHTWPSAGSPGNGMYLDEDGTLVRSIRVPGITIGGTGGRVQRIAFDGTVLWDYTVANSVVWHHHDIELLPNGNVLMIVWERLTVADAIAAGRDPALITGTDWLPDGIIEVEPTGPTTGNIVWQWSMMDHIVQDLDASKPNFGVVADHPEKLDINYPPEVVSNGDWNHSNSISYDPVNDIILLNAPFIDEFYLIDHSTTTAEAAGSTGGNFGKGGDFLYRWGNPQSYDRGTAADQTLFNPHGTIFIPEGLPGAGNLVGFNNQAGTPFGLDYSEVYELDIPSDFTLAPGAAWGPTGFVDTYQAPVPTDLYSSGLSNAERLPNGNTLVCSGRQNGWMFEIAPDFQTVVWEYFNPFPNPTALVFQVSYYERTLWAEAESISAAAGGALDLDLVAGTARAGDLYLILGSLSGTSPGVPLGSVTLPLNPDAYSTFTLTEPNSGLLPASFGVLDANGNAQGSFTAPPGLLAPFVGLTAHHAFVALDSATAAVTLASNAVPLTFAP